MKEQLIKIFQALGNINTKGDDTLIMADCLRALAQVVNSISEQPEIEEKKAEE